MSKESDAAYFRDVENILQKITTFSAFMKFHIIRLDESDPEGREFAFCNTDEFSLVRKEVEKISKWVLNYP